MSRKMLINASEPEEIRVSVVEGSILEEFYVERQSVNTCLGNIYKGRVTNIEPSIGAAFIEFGGPRHGFLHVSDVMEGSVFDRCAAGEDRPDEPDDDTDDDVGGEFSGGVTDVGEIDAGDTDLDAEVAADESAEAETGVATAEAPADGAHDDDGDEHGDDDGGHAPSTSAAHAQTAHHGAGHHGHPDHGHAHGPHGEEAPREKKSRRDRQIADLLKKGQEIIVQVTKDGIGTKGPTLTTYLSLPGRYLVLMPGLDKKGVSRKIEDAKERDRLKKVLEQLDTRKGLGFIVRTAGVGQTRAALQKDYRYLTRLWDRVCENWNKGRAPSQLYVESDLVIRSIRDIYTPEMGDIIIDEDTVARRAREFLAMVMPKAVERVKLYDGERPLFHAYGVEDEIARLFLHKVDLPSGGSLVIEQTEALVAIDVNSGRFRTEDDLEETAYKINCEAAEAVARQLRLRDLGGVIVVDFIDMRSEKRRRAVEKAFRDALKTDRARIKVARMSPFGVIEMTRQRVRPSLRHSIFLRCPNCRGAGYIATNETLELNLVRNLKLHLARRITGVEVFLNQENLEYLLNEKRHQLADLERITGKPIKIKLEQELRNDEFRIVPTGQMRV